MNFEIRLDPDSETELRERLAVDAGRVAVHAMGIEIGTSLPIHLGGVLSNVAPGIAGQVGCPELAEGIEVGYAIRKQRWLAELGARIDSIVIEVVDEAFPRA